MVLGVQMEAKPESLQSVALRMHSHERVGSAQSAKQGGGNPCEC